MRMVYDKKGKIVSRVISMVIGVLVGVLLLILASFVGPDTVDTIIRIGLIVYGVLIIIGNIPGLIAGIRNLNTSEGVLNLIFSILGIALGGVLIFYRSQVLVWIIALYMIVFPIIRIVVAKTGTRGEAFRRELLRMILGVVILVFLPGFTAATSIVIHWVLKIVGWVIIALTVLLGAVSLVLLLTAKEAKGKKVYVDTDGNGKIDTVYVDTTGDGKVDTAVRIPEKDDE